MEKAYIILNNEKYRVEFNWNAISAYLKKSGQDDMKSLLEWTLTPSQMSLFLHCALVEGARLDGCELKMSVDDLGSMLSIPKVYEFLHLFNEAMGSTSEQKQDAPNTKKKTLFRRLER